VSPEESYIAWAADEVNSAHHVLVKAITKHIAAGGTWESAFEEWSTASGRYVNRLGIHSLSTFRRRFAQWVTSYREQDDDAGATSVIRREEAR
jgi:hypothetical protein